ncbi:MULTISPECIES: hypothetical protein [Streptomyces]|uniref:Uncharacterized protein n=1 Tax=Streptomyces lycii TaxID=2654337 RepID=A0ABQ7F8U2_9ACTN|nr:MULTISPECIES: hypothetical protein [Streptomyces]KAF4405027.1 hypothetical protein GCU69_32620 [Streptomyces lycii]PGH48394.1 hypothetical protein CRI70_23285 [Streptomyces sp. Ru87]
MSLHDDLQAAQRCLDDLVRSVGRLETQVGGGPDIRRVRTDTDHLRESLALLSETAPASARPVPAPEMVIIPDAPYNSALWTDADEEGLGARDRHAP